MGITNRGFASMDPEKRRAIASKGGIEAHKRGVAHEWTKAEAREAGRKGGKATGKVRKLSATPNIVDSPEDTMVSSTSAL